MCYKTHHLYSFLLCFLLTLTFCADAQHFLRTEGKVIVNEANDTVLLRGMGLGGWMVQEGYMLQTASFANPQHQIRATIEALIGPPATQAFYDAWLENHVRRADIDSLKSWGFNSVRLPMHYNLFTLPIESEPVPGQQTWLTKGFELTDSLIAWCKANEMYVILDLHAAPGGQGYDEGISDYDPTKPSLWESPENRDKMVALWKQLASRYVGEQWVAGYDILNEPNWDLPGGTALRALYEEVTDSIRAVDTAHIIFIEGNWFANDFTGLTPPWDDNMVYSPHKYWSTNDQASIQGFLNLRDAHNIPLYLGESGENSNVWFRDAIRLLEDEKIGWAWWPMKKIESIAGPLSVAKTPEYQTLLDYWSGFGAAPSAAFATTALMDIADDLKIENCIYQKDVIDAMFRQVYSEETVPFNAPHPIPGLIYATDFDMGKIGQAYFDTESGNYQVSTGTYTSWNTGWAYRNDGVDIEATEETVNTNGYNVGWMANDEWLKYSIAADSTGVYDIHLRVASGLAGGNVHFESGGVVISPSFALPGTGGWQTWQSVTIPEVIIQAGDLDVTLFVDQEGFNLSSFEFLETGLPLNSIATTYLAATTLDASTIEVNVNKELTGPFSPADFEIFADGASVPISAVTLDPADSRIVLFDVGYTFKSSELIEISYFGTSVSATDGTLLDPFTLEEVENTVIFIHEIPTQIEAEAFFNQSGIVLETTTDVGGGQNVGYLDPGDYLDYKVSVAVEGLYTVNYRTASEWATGGLDLLALFDDGTLTSLDSPTFPPTGGWQTWATTTEYVFLPAGNYTLRVLISQSPFNMNWINFNPKTTIIPNGPSLAFESIEVLPNPAAEQFLVRYSLSNPQQVEMKLFDITGKLLDERLLAEAETEAAQINERFSLSGYSNGIYILRLTCAGGEVASVKLVKAN